MDVIDTGSSSDEFAQCVATIAQGVPPTLISPSAFATMGALARTLPATLSRSTVGFECRLADELPAADFMVLATAAAGRDSLAGTNPVSTMSAGLLTEPIWQRVQALAARWQDPASSLHPVMDGIWLEFDLDGPPPEIPRPSVFLGLALGLDDVTGVRGGVPDVEGYQATVAEMSQILLGRDLPPRTAENLAGCFRALAPYEYIFNVGMMVARGATSVRMCLRLGSSERTIAYLSQIGWPGAGRDLGALLELTGLVDYTWLDLDVSDTVHPAIGLECYFERHRQPAREPRWAVFLDALVRAGLCTSDKRDALLEYPGRIDEDTSQSWPSALGRASELLGGRWRSTFVRTLHHVKLVHRPGGTLEAKAYLAAHHHWRPRPGS